MKSALTLLAVLVVGTMVVTGQTPEQLFIQANQLYQQERFGEARDAFESIVSAGYESGALYYNLGNTYYRSGNIAAAILNYERARKFIPNDDDLLHNLQLANLMIADRIEPAPRLFLWDYWKNVKDAFSLSGLTWLTYFVYVGAIGCICAVAIARTYRTRKVGAFGAIGSGMLFLILLVLLVAKVSDFARDDLAIVIVGVTTIKNSPDKQSTDAFVLHTGVKVQITDRVNEWVKIRLADGKVGWMEKTAGEVI